jgi:hypothetical protein
MAATIDMPLETPEVITPLFDNRTAMTTVRVRAARTATTMTIFDVNNVRCFLPSF